MGNQGPDVGHKAEMNQTVSVPGHDPINLNIGAFIDGAFRPSIIGKKQMERFEFVVVGGGSAGMALAARPSQAGRKTLLIEAGRKKNSIFNFWMIDMPAAYGYA